MDTLPAALGLVKASLSSRGLLTVPKRSSRQVLQNSHGQVTLLLCFLAAGRGGFLSSLQPVFQHRVVWTRIRDVDLRET